MQPSTFIDHAPNGLQVEGRDSVARLALGVTASADVIDQSVAWGADALLVHHGYFWKRESPALTGIKGQRVRKLIQNQISLLAYHLPLDCHAEFGNNKTLLDQLGLHGGKPVEGENGLMWSIFLGPDQTIDSLAKRVAEKLGRDPLVIESSKGNKSISHLMICTGGAQDYLNKAYMYGADVYLSGEISERTTHEARELGVHYIAAGHHATERYGVQALGEKISRELDLEVCFFDDHNPA